MRVRPFHFHLEKVSREKQRIISALLSFLPEGLRDSIRHQLKKSLVRYLGDELFFYLERVETLGAQDVHAALPDPCILAILSLAPAKGRALLSFDSFLAQALVDKVVGGKGETPMELRPLTESEKGVLEVLLLSMLKEIHKAGGEKTELHFRLDGWASKASEISSLIRADSLWAELLFQVRFEKKSGFVKFYFPFSLITETWIEGTWHATLGFAELKRKAGPYGTLPVEIAAVLGESVVAHNELENLAAGDVLLLDRAQVHREGKGWSGEISVGPLGGATGFRAKWEGFHAAKSYRLDGIIKGEEYG